MKNFIKYICFTLVIILITSFSLTACSDSDTKQLRKAQKAIIKIGDQFLDYKITTEEASDRLESIALPASDTSGARLLDILKSSLEYEFKIGKSGEPDFDAIKDDIDKIKDVDIE